jgi:hypothetical protein
MGQEVVSGWLTQKRKNPPVLPENMEAFIDKEYIFDSCLLWSKGGSRYNNLKRVIKDQQKHVEYQDINHSNKGT